MVIKKMSEMVDAKEPEEKSVKNNGADSAGSGQAEVI